MTDDHELEGLDPYVLLDVEAARIHNHLRSLSAAGWSAPSRCEGWSVRDVLAHLTATERYHQACLAGEVQALFAEGAEAGMTSLEDWNEAGVRAFDGIAPAEILERWRSLDSETREGFRAAEGKDIDSSVGAYPGRWQAFHVASELATHADDMGVPVAASEAAVRTAWRARVSRFALAEAKPEISVSVERGVTTVTGEGHEVAVDDATLVEGVAARLFDGGLDEPARALLSVTP